MIKKRAAGKSIGKAGQNKRQIPGLTACIKLITAEAQ